MALMPYSWLYSIMPEYLVLLVGDKIVHVWEVFSGFSPYSCDTSSFMLQPWYSVPTPEFKFQLMKYYLTIEFL
jgi:hypothetical protein